MRARTASAGAASRAAAGPALPSVAPVAGDQTYWDGVRARVLLGVLVALVPVALLLWMGEGATAVVLTGAVTLASVALVPSPRERVEPR